jgi:CRP/FNR family transcriptional regulator, cyclic AMP receptor protein
VDTGVLCRTAIFAELQDTEVARLLAVARSQQCHTGECLFLLGDYADRLYVVLSGKMELTFPLSFGDVVRDVPVESKTAGSALGWSALVKPHRFTLSTRAAETAELAAFPRQDLFRVFEAEPRIGYVVMRHIAEVIGRRLLQVQALWARELQRAVTDSLSASAGGKR